MRASIFRFIAISAPILFEILTPQAIVRANPIALETARSQLGQLVRVDLGSKAVFSSERLEITVLSIDCYWGGEAQVKLNLQQAAQSLGDLDLTLGVGNPDYFYPNNIKRVGKYYIRVLAIDPYPIRSFDRVNPKVTQTVTLQVQKTPFKLKTGR
jgi:hypothetical protein